MFHPILIIPLAGMTLATPEDSRKVVAVIRNAYEENRAGLSAAGTIRFHATYGLLGQAASVEAINGLLKSDWKRHSPSRGMFLFDGPNRRYENLYPPEELVAQRTKTSATLAMSPIYATRLLSDGETTLKDNVAVDMADDKTVLHTPTCYEGTKVFFQNAEHVPLDLTDPDPSQLDLGRCLRDLMEGREGTTLAEIEESAKLDGVAVIKLRIDSSLNPRSRTTFWVDLEHGAIPLQTRVIEELPQTSDSAMVQLNYGEIRWAGKGWLPFRETVASCNVSSEGAFTTNLFVRETVVDEADFEKKPGPELFALEFPREFSVSDVHRRLGYGSRRVWTLKDFSPAARARARAIKVASPMSGPTMPGARETWKWWSVLYLLVGLACLLAAATLYLQRARRHAS